MNGRSGGGAAQWSIGKRVAFAIASIVIFYFVTFFAAMLLLALGGRLFAIWGITEQTVASAPGWAQALYQCHTTVGVLGGAILGMMATLMLRRKTTGSLYAAYGSGALVWGFAGLAVGIIAVVALRVTDSIRWSWPLNEPHISLYVVLWMLTTVVTCWAQELFYRDFMLTLFDGLQRWVQIAISVAVYTLVPNILTLVAGFYPVLFLNYALIGTISALLYFRMGGIRAAAAFSAALRILLLPVMGLPGAQASLYESYPVQLPLLSGGAMGPMNALALTVLLAGLTALLIGAMRGAQPRTKGAE